MQQQTPIVTKSAVKAWFLILFKGYRRAYKVCTPAFSLGGHTFYSSYWTLVPASASLTVLALSF